MDDLVGEGFPEWVGRSESVVDDEIISPNNCNLSTLHHKHLLLVWVSRVQCRVHSEPTEHAIVVADNDEERRDQSLSILR